MGRGPDRAQRMSQRKEDLLLASALARGQAIGSFNEVAGRADGIVARIVKLRQWLSNPLLWLVGGAAAVAATALSSRRPQALRAAGSVLRWGLLAWRLGRSLRAAGG